MYDIIINLLVEFSKTLPVLFILRTILDSIRNNIFKW